MWDVTEKQSSLCFAFCFLWEKKVRRKSKCTGHPIGNEKVPWEELCRGLLSQESHLRIVSRDFGYHTVCYWQYRHWRVSQKYHIVYTFSEQSFGLISTIDRSFIQFLASVSMQAQSSQWPSRKYHYCHMSCKSSFRRRILSPFTYGPARQHWYDVNSLIVLSYPAEKH